MQAEFKAIAIGDEEPSKRFRQGADVSMSVFNAIVVTYMRIDLRGRRLELGKLIRKLLQKSRRKLMEA